VFVEMGDKAVESVIPQGVVWCLGLGWGTHTSGCAASTGPVNSSCAAAQSFPANRVATATMLHPSPPC
jgi:hypothetical protein